MKKIIEICLKGAWLTSAEFPQPLVVDAVVTAKGGTVAFLLAGWWKESYIGPDNGMLITRGSFTDGPGAFVTFKHEGGEMTGVVGPADDRESAEYVADLRLEADANMDAYLNAWRNAKGIFGDSDADEWVAAIEQRSPVDLLALEQAKATAVRPVGVVTIKDDMERKVAVMAADEDGRVCVAGESPWLSSLANQYALTPKRPALTAWIDWIGTLTPFGMTKVGGTKVSDQGGSVSDVANKAMASFI